MSNPKPKPAIPPAGKPANRAGHVRHDKSGRAIWEWAIDTGRHALDSTSRLLKRLELPGLALEEDVKRRKEQEEEPASPGATQVPTFGSPREADPLAGSRGGFNPYDSRMPPPRKVGRPSPAAAGRPSAARPVARPAAPSSVPADKPGFFSRLFGTKR